MCTYAEALGATVTVLMTAGSRCLRAIVCVHEGIDLD